MAGFEVGFAAFCFPDSYKAGTGNMLLDLRFPVLDNKNRNSRHMKFDRELIIVYFSYRKLKLRVEENVLIF